MSSYGFINFTEIKSAFDELFDLTLAFLVSVLCDFVVEVFTWVLGEVVALQCHGGLFFGKSWL
jgi:hypothetical protein